MGKCDFSVWEKFDLGGCVHSLAFGWVPDWVWMVLPYWQWIVIIAGALFIFKNFGWPGLAAYAGGVGLLAGRKWGGGAPVASGKAEGWIEPETTRRPSLFPGRTGKAKAGGREYVPDLNDWIDKDG